MLRRIAHLAVIRGFALSVVALYLLLSIGILQTTHICMGREASVSYFSTEEKKCPCYRLLGEDMDCCHDEHSLIQLDDDHQLQSVKQLSSPQPYFILALFKLDHAKSDASVKEYSPYIVNHFLPPKEDLYKIFCSLVFYGDELIG